MARSVSVWSRLWGYVDAYEQRAIAFDRAVRTILDKLAEKYPEKEGDHPLEDEEDYPTVPDDAGSEAVDKT